MSTTQTSAIGVSAVLRGTPSPPQRTIFSEFALVNRVAVVTGGRQGIGLDMVLALAEAGAVVYCLALTKEPDQDWLAVQKHVDALPPVGLGLKEERKSKLLYKHVDVSNQQAMWTVFEDIVKETGRIDVCIACAGVLHGADCLEYPAEEVEKIMNVNVNGVLYTAQGAGRQMERLGIRGSIILIASMSGSITNQGQPAIAYNSSKAAVIQMARSMACELGEKGIRVNSISPGYIYTKMSGAYLDSQPEVKARWSSQNPLGRIGRLDEMRGVALWLASDASTFCTGSDIIVDGGHRAW